MRFADIDRQLDQLCDEIGVEPPPLEKRRPISFEEADAALDALAKEAAVHVPLPPKTRLPTDPPLPTAVSFADDTFATSSEYGEDYESFAPPASSMPAGVSSSEPPPIAAQSSERSAIPQTRSALDRYPDVPPAPSLPSMDGIPHRPPSSIPPVAVASFPSERPSGLPSERPSVSRSFSPPKFSESSVPPPTAEEPAVRPGESATDSEPPPGFGPASDEEADIMSAISERPAELAGVPSSVRPGRDEPTELLDLEDRDLVEMDLEDIEVDWDDDDAPTLQDDAEAVSPAFALGDGLSEEATQRESVAPALVESDMGSLVPAGVEVNLSSRPPSLSAATGGSQPPDETDWSDEFEDAFDILVDPDDPKP